MTLIDPTWPYLLLHLLSPRFWSDLVKVLSDVFTSVSKPSKGGWVREALISHYPRLAQALEAMFDRLVGETSMKVCAGGPGGGKRWRP